MSKRFLLSDRYRSPIRFGLAWVIGLGILSAMVLDMGQAWMVYRYTLGIYAALLLLIPFRRPAQPTTTDLLILKWSFPVLYFGGFLVYPYIWHLRGISR